MTIALDTQYGGSTANSYISVEDADAYMETILFHEEYWQVGLTEDAISALSGTAADECPQTL